MAFSRTDLPVRLPVDLIGSLIVFILHLIRSPTHLTFSLIIFSLSFSPFPALEEHLGIPIACNSVKLVDVPEFNIVTSESGTGEICVKGTNVFSGYWGEYDAYRSAMDKDGWFHTGDIGQWLPVCITLLFPYLKFFLSNLLSLLFLNRTVLSATWTGRRISNSSRILTAN